MLDQFDSTLHRLDLPKLLILHRVPFCQVIIQRELVQQSWIGSQDMEG